MDIKLFSNIMKKKVIICNENDCMLKIYNEFLNQIEKDINEIYFLYNGEKIIDYNITFNQMIKPFDKDNNEINILAYDVERNDSICSVKENEIPLIQSAKK